MPAVTHLRALQALELAIRCGSLKAAANELSISPAALGQRIRGLENYLGFDLLVRGRSGIRPTAELTAALAHLNAGFRELQTVAELLDFQRVTEIHVTADPDWAELWLHPRLHDFRKANPNTQFCINGVGDVPVRLGESDCVVDFDEPNAGSGADLLFHDYLVPVASPTNAARVLAIPEDPLEGFPLLHLDCYTGDGGAIGWPEWVSRYGYRKTSPGIGIRYRRVTHALEAVYADSGFLVCGIALVADKIDSGRLQLPFGMNRGEASTHAYAVRFGKAALRREPVVRFRKWLLTHAATTRDRLASATARAD